MNLEQRQQIKNQINIYEDYGICVEREEDILLERLMLVPESSHCVSCKQRILDKEKEDYMIESVIAHEYAHALLFKQGYLYTKDDGHSKLWQQTCSKLDDVNCQQYVD